MDEFIKQFDDLTAFINSRIVREREWFETAVKNLRLGPSDLFAASVPIRSAKLSELLSFRDKLQSIGNWRPHSCKLPKGDQTCEEFRTNCYGVKCECGFFDKLCHRDFKCPDCKSTLTVDNGATDA